MRANRRRTIAPSLALLACVTLVAATELQQTGCIGTQACQSLRNTLLAERDKWSECDPAQGDKQCVIIAGDGSDCTGVFRCDFAVNGNYLEVAQTAVLDNANEEAVCSDFCAAPTCSADTEPVCDPTFHRCMLRYFVPIPSAPPDAGAPPVPTPPDAAAD
jgi:hypothetical protein